MAARCARCRVQTLQNKHQQRGWKSGRPAASRPSAAASDFPLKEPHLASAITAALPVLVLAGALLGGQVVQAEALILLHRCRCHHAAGACGAGHHGAALSPQLLAGEKGRRHAGLDLQAEGRHMDTRIGGSALLTSTQTT